MPIIPQLKRETSTYQALFYLFQPLPHLNFLIHSCLIQTQVGKLQAVKFLEVCLVTGT